MQLPVLALAGGICCGLRHVCGTYPPARRLSGGCALPAARSSQLAGRQALRLLPCDTTITTTTATAGRSSLPAPGAGRRQRAPGWRVCRRPCTRLPGHRGGPGARGSLQGRDGEGALGAWERTHAATAGGALPVWRPGCVPSPALCARSLARWLLRVRAGCRAPIARARAPRQASILTKVNAVLALDKEDPGKEDQVKAVRRRGQGGGGPAVCLAAVSGRRRAQPAAAGAQQRSLAPPPPPPPPQGSG
jgi:hypothetical protein